MSRFEQNSTMQKIAVQPMPKSDDLEKIEDIIKAHKATGEINLHLLATDCFLLGKLSK